MSKLSPSKANKLGLGLAEAESALERLDKVAFARIAADQLSESKLNKYYSKRSQLEEVIAGLQKEMKDKEHEKKKKAREYCHPFCCSLLCTMAE